MPEPTSTAAGIATVAAYAGATSAITAFGVPLGLRADLLIAGFAGSLVAIILLNTVPGTGDTWQQLARTTWRRMAVACASSLTAGYLTPLAMLVAQLPAFSCRAAANCWREAMPRWAKKCLCVMAPSRARRPACRCSKSKSTNSISTQGGTCTKPLKTMLPER